MRRIDASVEPLRLIFLDYEMPIMDGESVVEELFKLYKVIESGPAAANFIRPKICCMSAHTSEQIRKHALSVGMDDYLVKPTRKTDMGVILDRYLKLS